MAVWGATQLTIGAEVTCADGVCGELDRLIVEPEAKVVTHIVVEPKRRGLVGRLVPVDLVDMDKDVTFLRCTASEFEALGPSQEEHPQASTPAAERAYLARRRRSFGFYVPKPPNLTYHLLPMGTVELGSGAQVAAKDGAIGRVQGLVIDSGSYKVTHVLMQAGRARVHRQVAIPISAVNWFDERGMGIQLNISKRDVNDLPDMRPSR